MYSKTPFTHICNQFVHSELVLCHAYSHKISNLSSYITSFSIYFSWQDHNWTSCVLLLMLSVANRSLIFYVYRCGQAISLTIPIVLCSLQCNINILWQITYPAHSLCLFPCLKLFVDQSILINFVSQLQILHSVPVNTIFINQMIKYNRYLCTLYLYIA